ncbi:hypothetical protein T4D_15846 [Trichinella pseudospiralis]|uniref:Uncharacterized protein n=1 Tax=Trichinella pseudospiralis TaxID=6337 RepID=A0A0V1F2Y2_TRIPS|nr:hypothetical protein T4D_15846 [Trichinella pseudospiralis]
MCINIGNAKFRGPFIPQPLAGLGKIRKFRGNLDFSKVDIMGIYRFGTISEIQ